MTGQLPPEGEKAIPEQAPRQGVTPEALGVGTPPREVEPLIPPGEWGGPLLRHRTGCVVCPPQSGPAPRQARQPGGTPPISAPTTEPNPPPRLPISPTPPAGLAALFGCLPLLYVALGVLMVPGQFRQPGQPEPPAAFGWVFVAM